MLEVTKDESGIAKHSAYLFLVASLVYLVVAVVLGVPGTDGDATSVFNVITRLVEDQRYTLSRKPGQPLLDFINLLTWSAGGEIGLQAWFALVSAAGVTALYQLLRAAGAAAPLMGTLAVGLNPLFIGHVGGLGDFAVSLAFLMMALRAGQVGRTALAGVLVGLCSGCRLPYVVYAIPVAALAQSGPNLWRRRASVVLWAGGVSGLLYAPLLAVWGTELLKERILAGQPLTYFLSAFLFRLLVSFGVLFWLLLGWLGLRILWKKCYRGFCPSRTDLAAALLLLIGGSILIRVPTKPELTLPIFLGVTIVLSTRCATVVSVALLGCSIVSGIVSLSPYDRNTGRYGWHLGAGHYAKTVEAAYDNRLMARTVPELLNRLPTDALFIGGVQWTEKQAQVAKIETVSDYDGIRGAIGYHFARVSGGQTLVSFQDSKLKEVLEKRRAYPRGGVYYDGRFAGMTQRWIHVDLSDYGTPVVLDSRPLAGLLSVVGRSHMSAVAGPD
jgi:MFS family permease